MTKNYFAAVVQFSTINEKGNVKKIKENYIVEANDIPDVHRLLIEKMGEGMTEFKVIGVKESNILGIIK